MENEGFDKRDYKDRDRDFDKRGGGDRDMDYDGDPSQRRFFSAGVNRKKNCRFCTEEDFVMDYKNTRILSLYLTEQGKLVPRRVSGNCALHQRRLTREVKRARNIALLGFTTIGF